MAEQRIALCAIVRNEIRGLVEWLAHYKAVGFNDILIYDNASTDGTAVDTRAATAQSLKPQSVDEAAVFVGFGD